MAEASTASGRVRDSAGHNAWALTFTSNLALARSSRRRSQDEAQKVFHWTRGGRVVKETQTGTESYSKGRQAGAKRKGEIDGVTGNAKQKFKKGRRLAITE